MNIYIDESIHNECGFMLLSYILCGKNPHEDIERIISRYGVREFHACTNMGKNLDMQKLRSDLTEYVNSKCKWGVLVLLDDKRYTLLPDILQLFSEMQNNGFEGPADVFLDEGLLALRDLTVLEKLEFIHRAQICSSHTVLGIQLADLIAALCGVRLKEAISGQQKILTYGKESGFDPPIEAELGFELWASLRYSMLHAPDAMGEDMPGMAMFPTHGYGFVSSPSCSENLRAKAEKIFGAVYLGCIH